MVSTGPTALLLRLAFLSYWFYDLYREIHGSSEIYLKCKWFYVHFTSNTPFYHLQHLDALLSEIKDIVAKHSDLSVLEASSRTYYILCSEKIAIYSKVDCARTQLIDELMGQLNQLLDGFWQKVSVTRGDKQTVSI